MNLIVLDPDDLLPGGRARLTGRRAVHVREVHRAVAGRTLAVGLIGGPVGRARVASLDASVLELDEIVLDGVPPPKLPLTLVLAVPRPKVVSRTVAAATSLGIARIVLVNAWKVEKSYWNSPRMAEASLHEHARLGLEQAGDTVMPEIVCARFFRPFVEDVLPAWLAGATALVAHPASAEPCPRALAGPCVLAIGPEGGWIDAELGSLVRAGFRPVGLGPRILRVETAVAALVGRLF